MKPQLSVALLAGMVLLLTSCSPSPQGPQSDSQANSPATNPLDQSESKPVSQTESNPFSQPEANAAARSTGSNSGSSANSLTGLNNASTPTSVDAVGTPMTPTNATIGVQILPAGLGLTTQKIQPGQVSFAVINGSTEAQKVLLIRTSLPLNELPIKNEALDFDNPNLQLVAQLNNGMMSAYGQDVINCILVPGQYLLMAYSPGKIRFAKLALIKVG